MRAQACSHSTLSFASSTHAAEVGYHRPTVQQRTAATTIRGKMEIEVNAGDQMDDFCSFPAPLVLPEDELSLDPRYPPQSMRAWIRSKDRNEVTPARNIIYVTTPPGVDPDVEFVRTWSRPLRQSGRKGAIRPPEIGDFLDYLGAFYDGMQVKPLPLLSFVAWDASSQRSRSRKRKLPSCIGLATSTERIDIPISIRPSPDKTFVCQLNLDDLISAAIDILPDDAYALLMLVDQDLFESEDDEFICGREHGGDRVAVISTARYNPILDSKQNVEREHTSPTSHCESYLRERCAAASLQSAPNLRQKKSHNADLNRNDHSTTSLPAVAKGHLEQHTVSALQAAVAAHNALPSLDAVPSATVLASL